ncbi:MAG: peptidase MA family metallohydrolase [Pyrinomonadaceae bacterium]
MKRLSPRLLLLLALAAPALLLNRPAGASRQNGGVAWVSVRTRNFLVEGGAGEAEVRGVAARLEAYRAAFTHLLSAEYFDAGVPTAVIVFPDDAAYTPFKPRFGGHVARGVAGYFQPGTDINYITLARASDLALNPSTLLHEYTHVLVNNHFSGAPLWLKEGLAEFYSTARLSTDGRRLTIGEAPGRRPSELRKRELLPLATLLALDQTSPAYADPEQRALFYAQSWALVHYLSEARGGRSGALGRFTDLLAEGRQVEDALREAFGVGVAELEAGLAAYVGRARYKAGVEEFGRPLDFDAQASARTLSEAEVAARLGDLLLHTDQDEEADAYLTRAVGLAPKLALARVSLGALRLRQNRASEAREHLHVAVEVDPQNYLAHYLLADALNREGADNLEGVTPKEFEERTELLRAELRRALELAPRFVESYKLLASVEMERGDRYEEAATLLAGAQALAPRRADLALMRAHALMLGNRFDEARREAEPYATAGQDERLRAQAAALVRHIEARREQAAKAAREANELPPGASAPAQPCDLPMRGAPQQKRLRFEGAQVCGRLAEIECANPGVVFRVETDDGATLRLRAEDMRRVRFITYTAEVKTGPVSCGPRERADHVLITYRSRGNDKQSFDGEALAVEFIPENWNP